MNKLTIPFCVALLAIQAAPATAQFGCYNCDAEFEGLTELHWVWGGGGSIIGVTSMSVHEPIPGLCSPNWGHEFCTYLSMEPGDRDALENPLGASVMHLFALVTNYSRNLRLDEAESSIAFLSCDGSTVTHTFPLPRGTTEALVEMRTLAVIAKKGGRGLGDQ